MCNCNRNRNNRFTDTNGFTDDVFLNETSTFNDDMIYGFGYADPIDTCSDNSNGFGRNDNRPIVTNRTVVATGNVFAKGNVFRIRNNRNGISTTSANGDIDCYDWRRQVFCRGYRNGYQNGFRNGFRNGWLECDRDRDCNRDRDRNRCGCQRNNGFHDDDFLF